MYWSGFRNIAIKHLFYSVYFSTFSPSIFSSLNAFNLPRCNVIHPKTHVLNTNGLFSPISQKSHFQLISLFTTTFVPTLKNPLFLYLSTLTPAFFFFNGTRIGQPCKFPKENLLYNLVIHKQK